MRYYHNIQKRKFNITCAIDLIDSYDDGELLMYSEAGNALLHPVSNEELQELISWWREYYGD